MGILSQYVTKIQYLFFHPSNLVLVTVHASAIFITFFHAENSELMVAHAKFVLCLINYWISSSKLTVVLYLKNLGLEVVITRVFNLLPPMNYFLFIRFDEASKWSSSTSIKETTGRRRASSWANTCRWSICAAERSGIIPTQPSHQTKCTLMCFRTKEDEGHTIRIPMINISSFRYESINSGSAHHSQAYHQELAFYLKYGQIPPGGDTEAV